MRAPRGSVNHSSKEPRRRPASLHKIKGGHPGLSICNAAKKLGAMWTNAAADDRQPCEKMAAKLKEKYKKGIAACREKGESDAVKKGVVKLNRARKRRTRDKKEEEEEVGR
ncbi:High mobility group protein B2 [Cricetulus griseus]|uniref:High mobility group protein B2 n=1 Tax=Cricetulus griseus TaxID=10029 RepID=G3GRG5_CRIGR|nr:High mobility group protein B2 [Cricetulus griseus]